MAVIVHVCGLCCYVDNAPYVAPMVWTMLILCCSMVDSMPGLVCGASIVIAIVITNQVSTSSRLLPGSSYSCCIRNLHALVHKQCHPLHITTAHEILQRRKWHCAN
jgi:hypothetical protein